MSQEIDLEQVRQLVNQGLKRKDILDTLNSSGTICSKSKLDRFMTEHGLSTALNRATFADQSEHWIEEARHLINGGSTQQQLLDWLKQKHNIQMSLRTLQSILSQHQIGTRHCALSPVEVLDLVHVVNQDEGERLGIRSTTQVLRELSGQQVSRDMVMVCQRFDNPEAVQMRKRRKLKRREYQNDGPNQVWHIDGFDKLSQFGFGISACVDGFSRYVVFSMVADTNRPARYILEYFLDAADKCNVMPGKVRVDGGTENNYIKQLQEILVGENSYIVGSSNFNTRIESYWGRQNHYGLEYWIGTLNNLHFAGYFNTTLYSHKTISQYCFGHYIAECLDKITTLWNYHKIRNQGQPIMRYQVPEMFDGVECGLEPPQDMRDMAIQLFGPSTIDMNDRFRINYARHLIDEVVIEKGFDQLTFDNCRDVFKALVSDGDLVSALDAFRDQLLIAEQQVRGQEIAQ
ncbi:hypothetical protein MP228_007913 [Amoeboaphelidium protococcarum]|nr:hypothetical protein MP228_007913 [Amoeboaphelidium protococcarum]